MALTLQDIKNKLLVDSVLLTVAIILPLISSLYTLIPETETETQESWFQRSGSILVILGAYVEYKLISMGDYFDLYDGKYSVPFDMPEPYRLSYKYLSRIALAVIITGTLIWGYGDLLL